MFEILFAFICFFSIFPFIDGCLALFWIVSVHSAWRAAEDQPVDPGKYAQAYANRMRIDSLGERQLAASNITSILGGTVTGTSIIIVGIGAFATLAGDLGNQPETAFHIFYAALFAVLALGLALYCLQILPSRTPSRNLLSDKLIAIFSAASLFFTLAAGARFLFAVAGVLLFQK